MDLFFWKNRNWSSPKFYIGEWGNNLKHGLGVYFLGNVKRYEGEFRFGKQHGYGVLIWPEGHVYEGYWVQGSRWGKGTLTFAAEIKCGTTPVDTKKIRKKFVGHFVHGRFHGPGKLIFTDGSVRKGEWFKGETDDWTNDEEEEL